MADVRPLALLFGTEPTAADWERLWAIKTELNPPFVVQRAKASPGGQSRVLAIGARPDFVCDYAYIPDVNSPGLKNAMMWALSFIKDERAVTAADMLGEMLGCEVKELPMEKHEQIVRFK